MIYVKIKKFQAKNVRSFKEEINIELSNFNVFIGENSSGKSNLISLIRTAIQSGIGTIENIPPYDDRFPEQSNFSCLIKFDKGDIDEISSEEEFNRLVSESAALPPQGTAIFKNDIDLFGLQSTLEFSSSWSREGNSTVRQSFPALTNLLLPRQNAPQTFIIQNQINFIKRFYSIVNQQFLRKSIFVSDTRNLLIQFPMGVTNPQNPIDAGSILTYVSRWMLNDRPTYDSFMAHVKRLLPRLADLQVEPSGNTASLFVKENGLMHLFSGNELSKGSKEILVVLGALALAKKSSIIFIEEPEIHLHPYALKELKSIMLDAVKERGVQIVISTHHPWFLEDLIPETDKSVKVFKFENKNQAGNFVNEIRTDAEISELIDKLKFNNGH